MRVLKKGVARRLAIGLRGVQVLQGTAADTLARMAGAGEPLSLRKRQVAFLPGDPGDAVYLIMSGRVKISRVTRDGKELTLGYRAAGEMFGELCLFDGGPREEMAEVVEGADLLRVERAVFHEIVAQSPPLGAALARVLVDRCRDLERQMEFLMFKDVHAKLAELLLRLSDEFGVKDPRGTLLGLAITHQEMANLIGSTRETVSLALSLFKRKRLVESDGRRVIVLDLDGLRAIA
jgi:CRP/FNR family transcriptional regulator, cyclic AMP receptor protein